MITYNLINRGYDLLDCYDDLFDVSPTDFLHTEYPYINLYEGEDEITVRAALPGMKSEELNI